MVTYGMEKCMIVPNILWLNFNLNDGIYVSLEVGSGK
jgi:hypothetical protein